MISDNQRPAITGHKLVSALWSVEPFIKLGAIYWRPVDRCRRHYARTLVTIFAYRWAGQNRPVYCGRIAGFAMAVISSGAAQLPCNHRPITADFGLPE